MQTGFGALPGLPERLVERGHVVAVHFDDVPSVGGVVPPDIDGHDRIGRAADLDAVHVDHDGDIRKPVLVREPAGLGHLPLCLLAVAHEHVDVEVLTPHFGGQREAAPRGEPLAQVPRRPVDERDALDHVALVRAFRPSEKRDHLVHRQVAQTGEACIDGGRGVAVAHHYPVADRPR